jgi:DNA-binding transcriptional ArsR family regulator
MAKYQINHLPEFMQIAKALADENRVRILLFLRHSELCPCQIIEMLGLSPSTVSKHLSVLKNAGLVESRKDGRWHLYRLPGSGASQIARSAIKWIEESLAQDISIILDDTKLKVVLEVEREKLCDHYKL